MIVGKNEEKKLLEKLFPRRSNGKSPKGHYKIRAQNILNKSFLSEKKLFQSYLLFLIFKVAKIWKTASMKKAKETPWLRRNALAFQVCKK